MLLEKYTCGESPVPYTCMNIITCTFIFLQVWHLTQTKQFQQPEIHLLHLPATVLLVQYRSMVLMTVYMYILASLYLSFPVIVASVCAVLGTVIVVVLVTAVVHYFKRKKSK